MQKHPSTDHGDSMLMKGTFPFFRFVCHKQLGCGAFFNLFDITGR